MPSDRKQLGAFYTPDHLVATVVDATVTPEFLAGRDGRVLRVLDPACGDGRFLAAVAERVRGFGVDAEFHGVDVDPAAVALARSNLPGAMIELDDALTRSWPAQRFDLVIGNPPFLSQLSERTTRGGASARGGGPYADVAAEFVALGAELVEPRGGRLAFVLPQSIVASRDAGPVRSLIDARASMVWSWWRPERSFDAQVHVVALAFEFGVTGDSDAWSEVITRGLGIPPLPGEAAVAGTLGGRATLNANFRDEYYGLVPAVGEHVDGPPLVTSGLVDPGRTRWGEQPITFARRRFERPRVDLERLDTKMSEWAQRRLVPKVLVANQTRIIEAVCDPDGAWLPGVPVIAVYPRGVHWDDAERIEHGAAADAAWQIAAVLTSGFASVWLWHRNAGTGLSAASVRVSPVVLAGLPWPAGDLAAATTALRAGDVRACARLIDQAFGTPDLTGWWETSLERIEARRSR